MAIRVVCSGCKTAYQAPESLLGKTVKCRQCQRPIAVTAPAAEAPTAPPKPAPPAASDPDTEKTVPKPAPAATPRPRKSPPPDDEVPFVLPARPRRRPKGHLTPLLAVAAISIPLILGALALSGWFVYATFFRKPEQAQAVPAPFPFVPGENPFLDRDEEPLMARQDNLKEFFLNPEEPPAVGLEFTEPPAEGEAPKLIKNATGQLTPEVLRKIKKSTVYIRTRTEEGESEGSGFFGGEPGVVVTNAHVVGMLVPGSPEPKSLRVVRNKGEKDEASFPAKVVAVDHDADLALLSVPKQGMPEPLVVKSALHLQETQPVYVAGFPLGELPGKSITINRYELSSLKKEKGVLDKLQVHGDMQPGNSGGPLLDAEGEVVGVCVAVLRNTRINFAIPADKVLRFLHGRLAELTLGTHARVADRLQVPVAVKVIDPLGRVAQAELDLWVGKPGPDRPGSRVAPAPQPGDGPRQKLTLAIRDQAGRGELSLPPLPAGQAYWLQPSLVSRAGAKVWLSAQVYKSPPPVERKPARLVLKPAGEWPLTLERWSSLRFPDPRGRDHRALLRLEARLTDVFRGRQGDDLAFHRRFTGIKEGVAVDGEARMPRRLQHVAPNVKFLACNRAVDGRGAVKKDLVDANQLQPAPPALQPEFIAFGDQMVKFLQGLEVALPGEEVQPGQTWKASRPLPIDPTWRVLGVLPSPLWGAAESESVDVKFTYAGVRTVNGVEQAVLNLEGETVAQPGRSGGARGRLSGTAVLDLATGQVVEEEVTTAADIELVVSNLPVIKAQGSVLARLRRKE
jgi:S1-C subfamily serine protease